MQAQETRRLAAAPEKTNDKREISLGSRRLW